MPTTLFESKAQEALDASLLLLERGWTNSAANRAYYAVFHAARAALVAAGLSGQEHSWSHKALQSAFSQLVRQRKIYPAHLASYLTDLRDIRHVADYGSVMVSSRHAGMAGRKAAELVGCIQKVILS